MSDFDFREYEIAFWAGYYKGDYNCDRGYFSWASNKAYLDMNRTMTFKDVPQDDKKEEQERVSLQRKGWRDEGTAIICNDFSSIKGKFEEQDKFDEWHKCVCKQLIDVYDRGQLVPRKGKIRTGEQDGLTYGQAQKWLNMTLKYIWLLNRAKLLNDKDSKIVEENERYFHIPLDRYILKYVARKDKNKSNPFKKDNGLSETIDFKKEWEDFGSEWSKITNTCSDIKKYYDYQQKVAGAINGGLIPLEWELIHWHEAVKFYG